jgi:hypothetical protein
LGVLEGLGCGGGGAKVEYTLCIQYTKVIGKVVDASTMEPLPFVNVYLSGTPVGTTTGFDIKIIDSAGADKAGIINWSVRGY